MAEGILLPQFIPPEVDLSDYALKSHSHTGYAASSHTHTGYASSTHSHSGYASSSHSHSGYATTSWVTANFAPKGSSGGTTTPSTGTKLGTRTVHLSAGGNNPLHIAGFTGATRCELSLTGNLLFSVNGKEQRTATINSTSTLNAQIVDPQIRGVGSYISWVPYSTELEYLIHFQVISTDTLTCVFYTS